MSDLLISTMYGKYSSEPSTKSYVTNNIFL